AGVPSGPAVPPASGITGGVGAATGWGGVASAVLNVLCSSPRVDSSATMALEGEPRRPAAAAAAACCWTALRASAAATRPMMAFRRDIHGAQLRGAQAQPLG
ncbi:hypothetical protein Vafri_4100, partial [Volvox africanus]